MRAPKIKVSIVLTMLRRPEASLLKTLADNVRAFRLDKGLSQEVLADICSLHRKYVGSIELMERNASLATLELLAEALDVGVPELLTPRDYAKKKVAT